MLRTFRRSVVTAFAAAIVAAAANVTARAQFCDPFFGCFGGSGIVDVSVSTDQPSYVVGDPIIYSVIAHNPKSTPVTLQFFDSRQADYTVDGIYSPDDIALQVLTSRQVPANGSVSWDFLHPWSQYLLVPGSHSVAGEVVGYDHGGPATFQITAPDPVTSDVLIDFEHYPNGTSIHDGSNVTYGIWNEAFIRNGVRFRSEGGGITFKVTGGNAALYTPSTSYPPGFNIVAEFEMPVYSVTADVGSAAGRTITMYAYDANGQSLGAVTSDPVLDYPNLVGPLSFDSDVPIASVQWFSSSTNASVLVDNLLLNVDLAETRGDFNGDGMTDAADYTLWRNALGQTLPIGSSADANHNGVVDEADYAIWRNHFGSQNIEPRVPSTVPEPSSVVLLISLALVACALRLRLR